MEAVRDQFEEVYHRHLPEVKRLVARHAVNPDDAQDLTQEVFVRAYSAYDSFKPGTNTGAWLYRIAINVCANAAKARQRYQKYVTCQPTYCDTHSGCCDVADILDGEDRQRHLRRVMGDLSQDQFLVLTLRFSDGLTLPEIAQVLSIPVDTVKSRLRTALARVQSAYTFRSIGNLYQVEPSTTQFPQDLDQHLVDGERGAKIYHSLGSLYLRKGLIAAALQEWSKAQKVAPDFLDAYLDSAQQYVALDQPAKAVDTLETAVNRIQNVDLHIKLADLYLNRLGDIDEGMQHSMRAIEMEPRSPMAQYAAGKAWYRKASIQQRLSWSNPNDTSLIEVVAAGWRVSSSYLKEAVRLKGTFPVAKSFLAISYVSEGLTDQAIDESLKAVDEAKGDDVILYHAAWVHYRARRLPEAEDLLRRSLAIKVTPGTIVLLAEVLVHLERNQEAYDTYTEALAVVTTPDKKALVCANLAAQALRLDNNDLAIEHAEAGLRWDRNHVHCRCNLAEAHQRKGEPPRVIINICMEGLSIDPYHKCFHRILAEAYYRQEKYEDAFNEATTAVELEPQQAQRWLLRAKILIKLGQYDEARQDVMAALDLEPDNEEARNRLEEIDKAAGTT